ncbi:hypothetical protein HHK36_014206 [Tetracentron sinense]|uniref:ENTH domain-containing protein n=1 Tax=Tetracentron sinense TaxID=13715 RepID=A0A835DEZ0_TETSI|nr:hypothetical protein HHK36_014206 [Tetracentron sinense]
MATSSRFTSGGQRPTPYQSQVSLNPGDRKKALAKELEISEEAQRIPGSEGTVPWEQAGGKLVAQKGELYKPISGQQRKGDSGRENRRGSWRLVADYGDDNSSARIRKSQRGNANTEGEAISRGSCSEESLNSSFLPSACFEAARMGRYAKEQVSTNSRGEQSPQSSNPQRNGIGREDIPSSFGVEDCLNLLYHEVSIPNSDQVLDATSNEPWGPHGSVLAEIAQATKKLCLAFLTRTGSVMISYSSECQMVMNVLWTRLTDTGQDWRHVYKALAVIEYLVGNGSERAVDDIIEHTFQISSLSGFEFVEPSGKDMGINVRKKVETIVALLNNKDKIQEVRNKAAANREKYVGLSSSGITYKSSSASYGSGRVQSSDQYGGPGGTKDGDMFKDSYNVKNRFGKEESGKDNHGLSSRGVASENQGKKGTTRYGRGMGREVDLVFYGRACQPLEEVKLDMRSSCVGSHVRDRDTSLSSTSRSSTKINHSEDKYGPIPSQSSKAPQNNPEDDFDDFNPRGTSTKGSDAPSFNQVDLLGESLIGDFVNASTPTEVPTEKCKTADVDLFADATFVSASPHVEAAVGSQTQVTVDLFASQPASTSAFSSTVEFFAAPDPFQQNDAKPPKSEQINSNAIDPFAAVPLTSFDGSDLFGAFSSHTDPVSREPVQNSASGGCLSNQNQKYSTESKPPCKKDTFQVKSGIWADSLSRGLIDLNISASKKVSLADIGIVGGLSDGSDEKEKGLPSSAYMGRSMVAGSGLGSSGFTSTALGGDDIFSNFSQQQFGSFKK